MGGAIIPDGLVTLDPWWINAFENPLTVQFDHRMFGYLLFALMIALAVLAVRSGVAAGRTVALAVLATVQVGIGVGVVVMQVPVHLALTHQFVAAIILWLAVDNAARLARRQAMPALQGVPGRA